MVGQISARAILRPHQEELCDSSLTLTSSRIKRGGSDDGSYWLCPYWKITLNPQCGPHGFTCGPRVFLKFNTFTHMWGIFFTCETHVRSCKHMWISCVPHVTHMSRHTWGSCGFLSLSITLTCGKNMLNWNNTQIHMWISCDFSVRDNPI